MPVLKFFIDYVVAPGLTWITAIYAALDWVGRTQEVGRSLLAGALMLLLLSAYAYQTGYRGFYRADRKGYFYVVFIAPILVGAVGLLAGLLLGSR
jgi:ACR3 family arsenite efflux pump ArsB